MARPIQIPSKRLVIGRMIKVPGTRPQVLGDYRDPGPGTRNPITHTHTRGFTLIEILVVLVIIAILTAVTVFAFGHFGRGRREQMIANQFSRVISAAEQEAILTSTVLGLGISSQGYQFYRYQLSANNHQTGDWQPLQSILSNKTAFHDVFDARVLSIAHVDSVSKKTEAPRI